jgi:hypothetical protein
MDSSKTMIDIAKGVTRDNAAPVCMPGRNPNSKTDHAINNITAADKRMIHLSSRFIEFLCVFDNVINH